MVISFKFSAIDLKYSIKAIKFKIKPNKHYTLYSFILKALYFVQLYIKAFTIS